MCFFFEVRFYFYKFYIKVEGRQAAEYPYAEAEVTFPERSEDVCSKVSMDKLFYPMHSSHEPVLNIPETC